METQTVGKVKLPSIQHYCDYARGNYGVHCLMVELGPVRVWFSYTTPVGFQVDGHCRVVHKNDWGPTTGRHLNAIDDGDKKSRVSGEDFERLWQEQVAPLLAKGYDL